MPYHVQPGDVEELLEPGRDLAERLRLRKAAVAAGPNMREVVLRWNQRRDLNEAQPCSQLLIDAACGRVERGVRAVNRNSCANQVEQQPAGRLVGGEALQRPER